MARCAVRRGKEEKNECPRESSTEGREAKPRFAKKARIKPQFWHDFDEGTGAVKT